MKPYLDFTCIYVKDTSINVDLLDESIKMFLNYLELELLNISIPLVENGGDLLSVVITCAYEQRKDSSGNLTKSLHNFGKAIDFSIYNKNRQQVHAEWTISDWSILKRAVNSINTEYNGKGVFQVIFESTAQADLEAAAGMEETNFIVLYNENSTSPHFHIQYKETSKPSVAFEMVHTPEEVVDDPALGSSTVPVGLDNLKFLYNGPNVRLFDLVESHPVFRNYCDSSGKIILDKVGDLVRFCGTDLGGVSNYQNFYNQWFSTDTAVISFVNEFGEAEILAPEEFKSRYEFKNSVGNYLIKNGTTIMLPYEDSNFLTTLALENGTRNQVSYFRDFPAFLCEKRKLMESDPQYVPTVTSNGVDYIFPEFTVWIYSHMTGSILDISKFCKNVILTSPLEGFNSATINLSFLDSNIQQFRNRIVENLRDPSLFSEYFSTQSLIWIRFESLVCEEWNQTQSVPRGLPGITEVPFSELPNKYYDFIGFVDNIYEVKNIVNSSYNVTLTAFSLEWALELDKAIFMPLAILTNDYGNGNLGFSDSNHKLMKRLSSQGEFLQLSQKILYTFEEVIKFYFGQIVQVGFVEEGMDIFEAYGSRRNTLFEFYPNELRDTVRETLAPGIYQIFKVEIDNYLKGRYFSDRNIALPDGSVYNLIKNVCIPPLVEVFSDTYGDTHHLVIRKPPFDYNSIKQYLDNIESDPNGFNTIKSSDVYSTELKWEDNFYTWFQIIPEGATPSVGEYINLLFQIIFVNEYVETWGSRGLKFSDPYLRDIESDQLNNFEETKLQIISDFVYILESYLYLPFTRKGRIVLNKGDRRIKKGTWVKLEPTDELFYVEKVDQKVSVSGQTVSRQTILTVSRGMLIRYILPPQQFLVGSYIDFSYFNICSLETLREDLLYYINNPSKVVGSNLKDSLVICPEIFELFKSRDHLQTGGGQVYFVPL